MSDPSGAGARTALSWQRTALGAAALAGLLLRNGIQRHHWDEVVASGTVALLAAVLWVTVRYRSFADRSSPSRFALVSALTLVAALITAGDLLR